MKKIELDNMSIDELWALHEKVSRILSERFASEKHELEKRLAYLNRGTVATMEGGELSPGSGDGKPRRNYPRVLPKYRKHLRPVSDVVRPRKAASLAGRGYQRPGVRSMISGSLPRAVLRDASDNRPTVANEPSRTGMWP